MLESLNLTGCADCLTDDAVESFVAALPMGTVCLLFAAVYLVCWFGFAPVYMTISDDCDLDAGSYRAAVYYRMITMTTNGFGTPDMTFNGCWAACWAIMAQTLLGVLANAAMVGTFYSKLSRGQAACGARSFQLPRLPAQSTGSLALHVSGRG